MIDEKIQGLRPLRPEPGKHSGFAAALTEALWYATDGRPFEELMAATGIAFRFVASPDPDWCPAWWNPSFPDLTLELVRRSAGIGLDSHALHDYRLSDEDPGAAWAVHSELVLQALHDRQPVLARGGWADSPQDWGVVTGTDGRGLPVGYPYRTPPVNALVPMSRPPWQIVTFGRESTRPAARALTEEMVAVAASLMRGEVELPADRFGIPWLCGPAALAHWAERLESGRFCGRCGDGCQAAVAAEYHASRTWGARFMKQTAGLRLGAVRPSRAVGDQLLALAAPFSPGQPVGPAEVRQAAAAELEIASALDGLLEATG